MRTMTRQFDTSRSAERQSPPMKLPAFEYAAPTTLAEAIALLESANGEARPLAGGQSLLPAMAYRLASPRLLVDLRNVPDLDRIDISASGVRIGARVRWRDIEDDVALSTAHPLLHRAISHVAHYQIRNRGTVGGSLAHSDPAAEMPGIAVVCDAILEIAGRSGRREMAAAEFITGPLSNALAYDELIIAVRLPVWPACRRWAFEEFAMRRGDFALAAIAVFFDLDGEGRVQSPHVGVMGACHRPHRLSGCEATLQGARLGDVSMPKAALAAEVDLDPPSDLHASAEYRRSLAVTLLERALSEAIQ